MHVDPILCQVNSNIRHMKKVISKVFFDEISLVAEANYKIIYAVHPVQFHDVPKHWATANFNHRLWAHDRFLGETSTAAARKDHCLHFLSRLVRWDATRCLSLWQTENGHAS